MGEFVPCQVLSKLYVILSVVLLTRIITRTETDFKLFSVLVNSTADKITSSFDKTDTAQTHPIWRYVKWISKKWQPLLL
jgi:hypothetical protein